MDKFEKPAGYPGSGKKTLLPVPRKPAVVLQPHTYQRLLQGVNVIAEAVKPTLGPLPRLVALERLKRSEPPEFLDDGATIARRIIQIEPRGSDVGAMLIRRAMWDLHLEVGDGTTTMAVIYQSLVNQGIHQVIRFGCNAMTLRTGLEKGLQTCLQSLRQDAFPLETRAQITQVALGMCQGDAELAAMLGEILDIVGSEGLIVVEGWNRRGLEREYIEGAYWKLSGWFSRHFVNNAAEKKVSFEDAAVLMTDLALKDAGELVPVLEKCVKAGVKRLVVLGKEISDSVTGLMVNNTRAKTIEAVVVRTPNVSEADRVSALEDMAALMGGKVFYSASGDRLDGFQAVDLGQARRVWATESLFGLYGGKGDPRQLRQQIAGLRGMLKQESDQHEKDKLQTRLGRLVGGTAILRLGAIHEIERERRKVLAERAVTSLRTALNGGVAPGGGSALLACQSALLDLPVNFEDEKVALHILSRALEEPMRVIAANAGYQPDVVIEKVKAAPKGFGLDARTGKIVNMVEEKILDSLLVMEKALEVAVSGAAMLLTTDVIVHRAKPKETVEP